MNYLKHFKRITKHKWYVGKECFKRKLYWQGLVHDLSKYSFTEFFTSAKYYKDGISPITVERDEEGYSLAGIHHKSKNKHHYTYWIDRKYGEDFVAPMPEKYIQEMLCDFIGAGKAYNKDWTPEEPLKFYLNIKDTILLHKDTRKRFEELL